jgi:hypothetical protein
MRYVGVFPLIAASLVGSATLPQRANAQYALDRLFLDPSNETPLNEVPSFSSETAVANFYGVNSPEASLAAEFYAGYSGASANMLFARYPVGGARARLYGSNISDLTLSQLQAINGPLSITSQGYHFSASVNLSGATSFFGRGDRDTGRSRSEFACRRRHDRKFDHPRIVILHRVARRGGLDCHRYFVGQD